MGTGSGKKEEHAGKMEAFDGQEPGSSCVSSRSFSLWETFLHPNFTGRKGVLFCSLLRSATSQRLGVCHLGAVRSDSQTYSSHWK